MFPKRRRSPPFVVVVYAIVVATIAVDASTPSNKNCDYREVFKDLLKDVHNDTDRAIDEELLKVKNLIHDSVVKKINATFTTDISVVADEWRNHFKLIASEQNEKLNRTVADIYRRFGDDFNDTAVDILNDNKRSLESAYSTILDAFRVKLNDEIKQIGISIDGIFKETVRWRIENATSAAFDDLVDKMTNEFESSFLNRLDDFDSDVLRRINDTFAGVRDTIESGLARFTPGVLKDAVDRRMDALEESRYKITNRERILDSYDFDVEGNCMSSCRTKRVLVETPGQFCNERPTTFAAIADAADDVEAATKNSSFITKAHRMRIGTYDNGSYFCEFVVAKTNCTSAKSLDEICELGGDSKNDDGGSGDGGDNVCDIVVTSLRALLDACTLSALVFTVATFACVYFKDNKRRDGEERVPLTIRDGGSGGGGVNRRFTKVRK